MTLIKIIQKLRSEGHTIEARKRNDGSYIITKINGQKFTNKEGNKFARLITGEALSERQQRQREIEATRLRKSSKVKRKKVSLKNKDIELFKRLRKVQRQRRKLVDPKAGQVTQRNIEYILETEGREKALEALTEAERYNTGLAYNKNIDWLIDRLNEVLNKVTNQDTRESLTDIIRFLDDNRDKILERDIEQIHARLYKLQQLKESNTQDIKALCQDIKNIITK